VSQTSAAASTPERQIGGFYEELLDLGGPETVSA
jgi:hypothetical protein